MTPLFLLSIFYILYVTYIKALIIQTQNNVSVGPAILIGLGRSLGNFRKSSKATLPIFCDALELVINRKVIKFGLNLINHSGLGRFLWRKPVFFRTFFNFFSAGLKRVEQKPNFAIYQILNKFPRLKNSRVHSL